VLWLESRMRDLILRGGENIYPMEIEHRLIEHPDIADAAVIGVPNPRTGEAVAAWVVLEPGASLTVEQVREHTARHLARYKVPATVEIVDALPRTEAGKLLRRELRTG
jgi:acyl-CoA synthetase (AMP-forming)/AMP-acid ligase II